MSATTDQPKRRNWFLRHKIITGLMGMMVLLIAGVAACTAALSSAADYVANPASASPASAKGSSGTLPKASQAPAGPTQGTIASPVTINYHDAPGYTLTLGSPQITTGPGDQYGDPPQNGYYVSIPVTMKALANIDSFDMPYVGDFYIVTPSGQHIDMNAGHAAVFGPHMDETFGTDTPLGQGESVQGWLVFDSPSAHGTLKFNPNADSTAVAQWNF